MPSSIEQRRARRRALLALLYGKEPAVEVAARLEALLAVRGSGAVPQRPSLHETLTPGDAVLITYADQVSETNVAPLASLANLVDARLARLFSFVHLLPFYPATSDDGFAVRDFGAVDPALGSWADVERLGDEVGLMFDAVLNHVSASHAWIEGMRAGRAPFTDYFITPAPEADLSAVVRPRATPLLTAMDGVDGPRLVWTTFSADQIDLNYANPAVLLEIVKLLLDYVRHGARILRLDAVAFLWKTPGTRCVHLPETHALVQLLRAILDEVAPAVLLITETNVPHADNVSYFGDGRNEAQLIYQFPLAPLVLHTFATGNAVKLAGWLRELAPPGEYATFFNFLACHDGIGLLPASGILSDVEIEALARRALAHGGRISERRLPDGRTVPYELNITLFDALSHPATAEPPALALDRFMAAQAIMLALAGVPGVWVHSLFGSPNAHALVAATGRARSINRHKWTRAELEAALADPATRAAQVFSRYARLLRARAASQALHPLAPQVIVAAPPELLVVRRGKAAAPLWCVHNVTAAPQRLALPVGDGGERRRWRELLTGHTLSAREDEDSVVLELELGPYQVSWLTPESESTGGPRAYPKR